MKRISRPLVARAALLLALLASAAPAARAGADAVPELRVYKSRFYQIHTNLPRETVVPFGRHMDRVFAQYKARFSGFRSHHRGAMPLFLLRTKGQYDHFLGAHGIDANNSGGMFFYTADLQGLATWTQGRGRLQTFSVLQHEGFHQFAYNYIGTDLPVWVNEGIAEYFEDAIITGSKMELGLADARRIHEVRRAIQAGKTIPFSDLLSISSRQWGQTLRNNPDRAALLYAQSWSLVYFLANHNRDTRAAFEKYLKLLSSGRRSETAFRQAFGIDDLAPVRGLWEKFAEHQKPDPIHIALTRMDFLGTALRYLRAHHLKTPATIGQLRRALRARHFTVTRTAHGLSVRREADDDDMFRYPRPGGDAASFQLLEPAADDLPPRITAPGLVPRPTLVWSRNDRGELVQDVRFR